MRYAWAEPVAFISHDSFYTNMHNQRIRPGYNWKERSCASHLAPPPMRVWAPPHSGDKLSPSALVHRPQRMATGRRSLLIVCSLCNGRPTAGTTPDFLDKLLLKDDVPEILANILDAQTKSELLGRVLKLSPSRVSGIHMQYRDPEECLFCVIDEFVKQVDPRPTWRVILTALRHPTIRLTGLANEIESKHCPPTICGTYIWSKIVAACFLTFQLQ